MPKYSILTTDCNYFKPAVAISQMNLGIKLLLFGNSKLVSYFNHSQWQPYKDAGLLKLFTFNDLTVPVLTIVDGAIDSTDKINLESLVAKVPEFNYEQYQVEHAPVNKHLMIEAGAGTGKTTVMVDRVLFLLHTVPNLSFDEIGMITFTNEATLNMKSKIQNQILKRFEATRSSKYLLMLEDSSRLLIKTIHEFSKNLLIDFGETMGYGHDLSVRSFKFAKKELITEVLDDFFQQKARKGEAVRNLFGANLHELVDVVYRFWERFEQLGLSKNEIKALDWGQPTDYRSEPIHENLKAIFAELDERYSKLKLRLDSIGVEDIVRELRRVLDSGKQLSTKHNHLKFLFVDEFQDSDNAQIRTIEWMVRYFGLRLFVVGDVKQSIYRFRGAVETAFAYLRKHLKHEDVQGYSLVKNYRTTKFILNQISPYFADWSSRGLLTYEKDLVAQKVFKGTFNVHHVLPSKKNSLLAKKLTEALKEQLKHQANRKVVVLTRTNHQLQQIQHWCHDAGLPCYIQKEGTFFTSKAVLDFFALVRAYLYPTENSHLYDLLVSSYGPGIANRELISFKADSTGISRFLHERLEQIGWEKRLNKLRLRPVLQVLCDDIQELDPSRRFMLQTYHSMKVKGWNDTNKILEQVKVEVSQYKANLNKLLKLLNERFATEMACLNSIYEYLDLHIKTDSYESEPLIESDMTGSVVQGMTVHKAKGLEFDCVLIPFTYKKYRNESQSELLLHQSDKELKVGWRFVYEGRRLLTKPSLWVSESDRLTHCYNSYFDECVKTEVNEIEKEEARILYVAMTRAIKHLEIFIVDSKNDDRTMQWAGLLE